MHAKYAQSPAWRALPRGEAISKALPTHVTPGGLNFEQGVIQKVITFALVAYAF
jgi:hypothetical protein